ncbi:hypothetical protein DXG03_001665 [Asterophora parasitica]|uniref:Telomerase reverse transcriptase n=1 Tax=Asterophora parasitica TaxID=117018 RepID=A0A9P7GH03_9AGAR|nr:hypothetical protein DXG03_001665 [Asterophora parasitica]
MQGFSTSACDWLIPPGAPALQQSRVSVSDALKRRELLEEFVFWYFDSFVSSLLKTNFYITETSAFRNRVLYFRHDDWEAMCAPLIGRLATGTFMKMTEEEVKEVLRQRTLGPPLYFVKVDVQACFDTIEQTKLLEILRELISEDRYMTHKYGQVQADTGRIKRQFVKKAIPDDDHPHFLTYAAELAGVLRNIIFVDQVVYPYSTKQKILALLEEHITENIVKIGAHYYRQTIGIAQGSILSAILCSFFYGDLERKKFKKFKDDLESVCLGALLVLLRLIDDYLFITTSRKRAFEFLKMMNEGHPEYGCFISKEKTLANFDFDDQVSNVTGPKQERFPWCGHMIHMKDLSVTADYSRYNGTTLRDTLTIDRGRHPGVTFTHKMLWLARSKCVPIYSDSALNTTDVIYLNVYQNFLLCAMKMHGYLSDWGRKSRRNSPFIYGMFIQSRAFSGGSHHHTRNRHNPEGDTQFVLGTAKQDGPDDA